MKFRELRFLGLGLMPVLFGCGETMNTAAINGNGSETTNGFSMLVVKDDWTRASNVALRIRPSDSLSGSWGDSLLGPLRTRLDTVCDTSGLIRIGNVRHGSYTVELSSSDQRSIARVTAQETPASDTIQLQQASVPAFQDSRLAGDTLRLYGLEREAVADGNGLVQWDSLPVGNYAFRASNSRTAGEGIFNAASGNSGSLISYTASGSCCSSLYQHAAVILLKLSNAGANVSSRLTGLPIPLALTARNFSFSGTGSNDLKFISNSGQTLPYAVESWDADDNQANLWLRLDTLTSTNSQTLQMYWGGSSSNTRGTVFDTANGWFGVWHLRQSLDDATANGNAANGTSAGVVGWYTDGTDSLILPDLPESDSGFTISMWLLPDTSQRSGAPIVRQVSENSSIIPFSIRMGPFSTWIEAHYPDSATEQSTRFPTVASEGEWLQVAITYSASTRQMRLYLNGQQWSDAATVNTDGISIGNGHLLIGGQDTATASGLAADRLGYRGLIREIRLSRTARSAEWISAEYSLSRSTGKSPLQIERLH